MNIARTALIDTRLSLFVACTAWLCLLGTIHSPIVIAQILADTGGSQSRFYRTVHYLQDASPQLRGQFATIALTQLIDGYLEEARLVNEESRTAGAQANARSWSLAVSHYANQIPLLLDDIALGLPVRLTEVEDKSLAITVTDRTIILNHPRFDQQHALEHGILLEFCALYPCAQFMRRDTEPVAIAASRVHVRPHWTFTARGAVCAYQGIEVQFKNGKNLAASRAICNQFLQEAISLANEISWHQALAVPIQWSEFEIQATAGGAEHLVRLNGLGDVAAVTVPLLYANQRLFEHILPWARQWLAHRQEASIQLKAHHYDWGEP
ncbi:MAG: hypothetical protein P8J79_02855 [Halioglobus sp.]|nr:hypothetical protein [Halioglobus sp.]